MEVNFADRAFVDDPFPAYEEIRAAGRAVWNPLLEAWMVTSFKDCTAVLRDRGDAFREMNGDIAFWFDAPNMLTVDGAEHDRLRDSLNPIFTKTAIAKWEQRVVEIVDQLLTPLMDGHSNFGMGDFTMIPTVIVGEMLGVPEERYGDFRRWSHVIVDGITYGHEQPDVKAAMKQVSDEVNEYLTEEIERHRQGSFDDVLSLMLEMRQMSDAEMRSTAIMLLLAGYDTTAKLMALSLVVLEQHPEQRRLLVENPMLMATAIEEVLRWGGVAHIVPRLALRETKVGGTTISTGEIVYALTGAANRDPARWTEPARFDILREAKSNLAFGYGPHLCIGLWLARLEARVALQRILELAPDYRLRDVTNGPSYFVRGPDQGSLEVAVASA
jgi:cytochrome P450